MVVLKTVPGPTHRPRLVLVVLGGLVPHVGLHPRALHLGARPRARLSRRGIGFLRKAGVERVRGGATRRCDRVAAKCLNWPIVTRAHVPRHRTSALRSALRSLSTYSCACSFICCSPQMCTCTLCRRTYQQTPYAPKRFALPSV
jgi:hypothetical protein